ISLGVEPSAFPKELGGFASSDQSSFARPKGVFDTAVRGSAQYSDRIWFFRGDSYLRYFERPDGKDKIEGLLPIASNWQGWPQSFSTGIDAALLGTGTFQDKIWFFKGSHYLRYDIRNDTVEFGPKPIEGNWRGLTKEFNQGIDAAIHGVGNFFGVCWMFKGNQYLRYNFHLDMIEYGPLPIQGNWGGDTWPATFADGVDFAFYGTGANAEKIYFFRGDKYILYNLKTDRVEEGPASIIQNWPIIERFTPQPQLFIAEHYALRTFQGEIGRGPIVEGSEIKLPPGGRTEFYIITKKSETINQRSSSNILESQSQETVDLFSESVRESQDSSGSTEHYDYQLNASFRGEAGMTWTGGETEADFNAKGST
ncbi:MAG TPA: hemopexin repeat-containing protein, partial [Roseiflexaceae bacterium]|nr:hemopexin repeat-containing protein [Roseiflexaceae bacterium]